MCHWARFSFTYSLMANIIQTSPLFAISAGRRVLKIQQAPHWQGLGLEFGA